MPTISERGLFWLRDSPIEDRCLAPENALSGLLTIDGDGLARLELDGTFGPSHTAILPPKERESVSICGILRSTNKYIFMTEAFRDGSSYKTNGISYINYSSLATLVGDKRPPSEGASIYFDRIEISLEGYEDWIDDGPIKQSIDDDIYVLKYETKRDLEFTGHPIQLTIKSRLDGLFRYPKAKNNYNIKEIITANLNFGQQIDIETAIKRFIEFEEFLFLLTGATVELRWPTMSTNTDSYRLYFARQHGQVLPSDGASFDRPWVTFDSIKEDFGKIYNKWVLINYNYGSGVYLYSATSRNRHLHVEHKFINLVWGIESFHRNKYPGLPNEKILMKVDRILKGLPNKDARWLRSKLRNITELPLDSRITELVSSCNLGIDEARIRRFSANCAKRRNDISHFGGPRDQSEADDFYDDIMKLTNAISYLYQILILLEIEISHEIVVAHLSRSRQSFQIRRAFRLVGLLEEEGNPATQFS